MKRGGGKFKGFLLVSGKEQCKVFRVTRTMSLYLLYLYQVFNFFANLLGCTHVRVRAYVYACVCVFSVLINLKCLRKAE